MLYIVQENVFREENYDKIFESLNRLGLDYEVVPVTDQLHVKTVRKDVFCFGSIRLARLATEKGWNPGSFYGGNHDFEVYKEFYKENLLNYDSKIQEYDEPINFVEYTAEAYLSFKEIGKFIRPCKDSKIFTGAVFSKIKWEDKVKLIKEKANDISHSPTFLIQVTEPKVIFKEARVWIVDGKVITSSYYKFGDNVQWSEDVEPEGLEFAQSMVDLYQVADAFVMDICLTPDGWKIVEINCINCSGFYKGDLQKILIALENKYNPI